MQNKINNFIKMLIVIFLTLLATYQIINLSWIIYQQKVGSEYIKEAVEYYRNNQLRSDIN